MSVCQEPVLPANEARSRSREKSGDWHSAITARSRAAIVAAAAGISGTRSAGTVWTPCRSPWTMSPDLMVRPRRQQASRSRRCERTSVTRICCRKRTGSRGARRPGGPVRRHLSRPPMQSSAFKMLACTLPQQRAKPGPRPNILHDDNPRRGHGEHIVPPRRVF